MYQSTDAVDSWAQGIQMGAGIARDAMAASARQQELKSQDAYRKFQEQQLAQHTQMLMEDSQRKKEEYQSKVQDEADTVKALVGVDHDMHPFSKSEAGAYLDPSQAAVLDKQMGVSFEQAMMSNLGPVVAKRGSKAMEGFVNELALNKARVAQEAHNQALAKFDIARANAIPDQADARIDYLNAGTTLREAQTNRAIAQTDFVKNKQNELSAARSWEPVERTFTDSNGVAKKYIVNPKSGVAKPLDSFDKMAQAKLSVITAGLKGIAAEETHILTTPDEKMTPDTKSAAFLRLTQRRKAFERQMNAIAPALTQVPAGESPQSQEQPDSSGDLPASRIQVKDSTGKVVGHIPNTPSQIRLAAEKGLTPVSAPGRAAGGPVAAGQPYTVGEKGPETFVPAGTNPQASPVPQGTQIIAVGGMGSDPSNGFFPFVNQVAPGNVQNIPIRGTGQGIVGTGVGNARDQVRNAVRRNMAAGVPSFVVGHSFGGLLTNDVSNEDEFKNNPLVNFLHIDPPSNQNLRFLPGASLLSPSARELINARKSGAMDSTNTVNWTSGKAGVGSYPAHAPWDHPDYPGNKDRAESLLAVMKQRYSSLGGGNRNQIVGAGGQQTFTPNQPGYIVPNGN